ncbi:MAG: hypothetical protein ACYSW8_32480 [Planctomycetota bacterium]
MVGNWVREVLETMDDEDSDEYYGTYRDMGKCFRDAAYQVYLAKKAKYGDPEEFKKFIEKLLDLGEEETEGETDPDWVEIDTNECCTDRYNEAQKSVHDILYGEGTK